MPANRGSPIQCGSNSSSVRPCSTPPVRDDTTALHGALSAPSALFRPISGGRSGGCCNSLASPPLFHFRSALTIATASKRLQRRVTAQDYVDGFRFARGDRSSTVFWPTDGQGAQSLRELCPSAVRRVCSLLPDGREVFQRRNSLGQLQRWETRCGRFRLSSSCSPTCSRSQNSSVGLSSMF